MATLDQSQTTSSASYTPFGSSTPAGEVKTTGQSFTASITKVLDSIEVCFDKNGSPTGTVSMEVYTTSGGNPDVLIATANNTIAAASITAGTTNFFTYTFTTGTTLISGTKYFFLLRPSADQDISGGNSFKMRCTSNVYADGEAKYQTGSGWFTFMGEDLYFKEYYNENATSASPSLSPSASQSPSSSVSLSTSVSISLSPSLTPSLSSSLSISLSSSLSSSLSISPTPSPSLSISATPSASPSRSEYDDLYDLKSTSYTPKYTNWGPGNNMGGSGYED